MDKITQYGNIIMTKGDVAIREFYIQNRDGAYIDLDNASSMIYFTVRNRETSEKMFNLYFKNGDTIAGDGYPTGGIWKEVDSASLPIYKMIIRAENTQNIEYVNLYEYDMQVNVVGSKFTIFYGRFDVEREVTLPTDETK